MKIAWIMAGALALAACPSPTTPAEKKAAAETTFTGQLAECVDLSRTRAEADTCAEEVRRKWAADAGGAR